MKGIARTLLFAGLLLASWPGRYLAAAEPSNSGGQTSTAAASSNGVAAEAKPDPAGLAEALTTPGSTAPRGPLALNVVWLLLCGFLVILMQAGFGLTETGLTRARNATHTMTMNLLVIGLASLGFLASGFALLWGGSGAPVGLGGPELLNQEAMISLFGKPLGIFGHDGFFLAGHAYDAGVLALFLFQAALACTAATIATGALAERWKFLSFVAFGLVMAVLIYPVFGNWVWGGGWLSQLGASFGLGHGVVDFAGSSVVHMTGGIAALVGCLRLGPRIGKYNRSGSVNVLLAHNAPMYMLGTLVLFFGWFGFTAGHALPGSDMNVARVAVNTLLGAAGGALTSMTYLWRLYRKPDPSFICNGVLAGLVAISAPCAFVTPLAALVIGGVAGVIVVWSVLLFERTLRIDDPVGAISVHAVAGAWGLLALGLLADGTYGRGWNHSHLFRVPTGGLQRLAEGHAAGVPAGWTEQGVTGLFYGNTSQLAAQCVGLLANVVWVLVTAYVLFWLLDKLIGNRVGMSTELQGLDVAEMGVIGYVNEEANSAAARPTLVVAEPRAASVPRAAQKQLTILVDGVDVAVLQKVWSELCQPGDVPPERDFLAIYPQFTTLKGNRFRFRGGDPTELRSCLERLLKSRLPGKMIQVRLET